MEELRRIKTYVGATGRVLQIQVRDAYGVVVDLSGYTSAALSGKLGSVEVIKNAACDIQAGTDGWVYYAPVAADLETAGDMGAQIKLTAAGAVDFTDKFIIEIDTPHDYT